MMEKLYENYLRECGCGLPAPGLTFPEFQAAFGPALADMAQVSVSLGPDCMGVMHYDLYQDGSIQICDTPVFGYYASSEKALSLLISQLIGEVLKGGPTRFQLRIYANDVQAQRLLSMMQFGYMSEKCVCRIDSLPHQAQGREEIRTLTRDEIEARWPDIWALTHAIVQHLQQPPVCYPGREFTEDVYRDFFMDSGTHLHAAFSPQGQMIGIIETNDEPDRFITPGQLTRNVGEAYVLPEYRGHGLAQRLLCYAACFEQTRGAAHLWVEHGTANPNARLFWGKYFTTYQYELDRMIEPVEAGQ